MYTGACTIKHYQFVIYSNLDKFCSKLVYYCYYYSGLDKNISLLWNLYIMNLYCFIVQVPGHRNVESFIVFNVPLENIFL